MNKIIEKLFQKKGAKDVKNRGIKIKCLWKRNIENCYDYLNIVETKGTVSIIIDENELITCIVYVYSIKTRKKADNLFPLKTWTKKPLTRFDLGIKNTIYNMRMKRSW